MTDTQRTKVSFDSLAKRRSRGRRNSRRDKSFRRADRNDLLNDIEVVDDGIGAYSYYPISGRVAKKL